MKIIVFILIIIIVVVGALWWQKKAEPEQENPLDAIPALTNAMQLQKEQQCVKSCTTQHCPGGACPSIANLHSCIRDECGLDPADL